MKTPVADTMARSITSALSFFFVSPTHYLCLLSSDLEVSTFIVARFTFFYFYFILFSFLFLSSAYELISLLWTLICCYDFISTLSHQFRVLIAYHLALLPFFHSFSFIIFQIGFVLPLLTLG